MVVFHLSLELLLPYYDGLSLNSVWSSNVEYSASATIHIHIHTRSQTQSFSTTSKGTWFFKRRHERTTPFNQPHKSKDYRIQIEQKVIAICYSRISSIQRLVYMSFMWATHWSTINKNNIHVFKFMVVGFIDHFDRNHQSSGSSIVAVDFSPLSDFELRKMRRASCCICSIHLMIVAAGRAHSTAFRIDSACIAF